MKIILPFLSLISVSMGMTLVSSTLSSTGDITYYSESAGQLQVEASSTAVDPSLTMTLSSSAGAAGGNVELYASSDGLTDMSAGGAFANATPIVLNTSHTGGGSIQVRSLNGMDWFMDDLMAYNLSYGANNLANRYFADITAAALTAATNPLVFLALSPGNLPVIFNTFLNNGGFAQISDPNVSYVEVDANGNPVVGLAGFLDASSRLVSLGLPEAELSSYFGNGIQVSEVAMVNGEALYSFNAVSSGVVLNDGVDSYSATYEVTGSNEVPLVPEPSAALLALLGSASLITRRKR